MTIQTIPTWRWERLDESVKIESLKEVIDDIIREIQNIKQSLKELGEKHDI